MECSVVVFLARRTRIEWSTRCPWAENRSVNTGALCVHGRDKDKAIAENPNLITRRWRSAREYHRGDVNRERGHQTMRNVAFIFKTRKTKRCTLDNKNTYTHLFIWHLFCARDVPITRVYLINVLLARASPLLADDDWWSKSIAEAHIVVVRRDVVRVEYRTRT